MFEDGLSGLVLQQKGPSLPRFDGLSVWSSDIFSHQVDALTRMVRA